VTLVRRDEDRAALRAEVDPDRIQPIRSHPLAQHFDPSALRKAVRRELPALAAVLCAIDAQPALARDAVAATDLAGRAAHLVLGDHERHVRLAMMDGDRKAERAWEAVVLEPLPALDL